MGLYPWTVMQLSGWKSAIVDSTASEGSLFEKAETMPFTFTEDEADIVQETVNDRGRTPSRIAFLAQSLQDRLLSRSRFSTERTRPR